MLSQVDSALQAGYYSLYQAANQIYRSHLQRTWKRIVFNHSTDCVTIFRKLKTIECWPYFSYDSWSPSTVMNWHLPFLLFCPRKCKVSKFSPGYQLFYLIATPRICVIYQTDLFFRNKVDFIESQDSPLWKFVMFSIRGNGYKYWRI